MTLNKSASLVLITSASRISFTMFLTIAEVKGILPSIVQLIHTIKAFSYALVKSIRYSELASACKTVLPLNRRPTAVRPNLYSLAVFA
jgi:hypothetical protein